MKWIYINTGDNTGLYNMEFDMNLVKDAVPGIIYFRLYRWSPYCVSLGANQDVGEIDEFKVKKDGIDLVKRPTGGRAILHSEELTYSIIMLLENDSSPRNIYRQINLALINGLKIYNFSLTGLEIEGVPRICFHFIRKIWVLRVLLCLLKMKLNIPVKSSWGVHKEKQDAYSCSMDQLCAVIIT